MKYSKGTRKNVSRKFVGDFETTVYDGQKKTEVWASALVELGTENVQVYNSIDTTFQVLCELAKTDDITVYYHNLKFDGSFWIDYLLRQKDFKQAYYIENDIEYQWFKDGDMGNNTYKYVISDMGQWYFILIKVNDHFIKLVDSLKLLPFSVSKIGKSFQTKHKKLEMEYNGYRYAGCEITTKEKEYIANDVLVVKEALEMMLDEGHDSMTIGSCCLKEYKSMFCDKREYYGMFPNLKKIELDPKEYKYENADAYVRKSYKGGWCYLVKGKENRIYKNGITADVNSLYPSVMSSESGNWYPVGNPTFWKGDFPDIVKKFGIKSFMVPYTQRAQGDKKRIKQRIYYFVRFRTQFNIKPGYLPFIQSKGDPYRFGTEMLETSDIYDAQTGLYYDRTVDENGQEVPITMELTMTCVDFELFKEHYELKNLEILDGCYFKTNFAIFDEYMSKYAEIKKTSKGAKRELAKLFLNNLYGKMASSDDSSFKVAMIGDDDSVKFVNVFANDKKVGYIPIGSAITSYAREFTIRTAQKNFHGVDKPGFIYADTDSIHCDLSADELKGVPVDPVKFCHWKLETSWDKAIFVRQKTYIEHVTHENLELIEKPYYNVRCAGMPDRCKDLFIRSISGDTAREDETKETKQFLSKKRAMKDFKNGLIIPGKLVPKRIPGGVILTETTYEIK